MIWLLAIFRGIALWMKRSGLITGNTDKDRRVFLQAFVAMGGAALFRNVPAPDTSMPVVNIKSTWWFRNPGLKHEVVYNDYSQMKPEELAAMQELDAAIADPEFTARLAAALRNTGLGYICAKSGFWGSSAESVG